jgi:hypothetical protein
MVLGQGCRLDKAATRRCSLSFKANRRLRDVVKRVTMRVVACIALLVMLLPQESVAANTASTRGQWTRTVTSKYLQACNGRRD